MNILRGDIVNTAAVLLGGLCGWLLHLLLDRLGKGSDAEHPKIKALRTTVMQGLALCVIMIGINGIVSGVYTGTENGAPSFRVTNSLITILSMVVGICIGALCDLDGALNRLGKKIEERMNRGKTGGVSNIAEGFVSATLLFCVGAMAIVGSLDSGISGDHSVLYTKSLIDGIAAIVLSSTLGFGVMLSAVPLFCYQGIMVVLADTIAPVLTDACIAEMNAVGCLLIIAIGLNMLGLTKIKVMNGIPAIFLPILLCRLF